MSGTEGSSSELLTALERRLQLLESTVVGPNAAGPSKDGKDLSETVHDCYLRLKAFISQEDARELREVITQFRDIEDAIDPRKLDNLTLVDEVKEEMILSDEPRIFEIAGQLEELSKLQEYVNTKELQDVTKHTAKLKTLEAVHLSQLDKAQNQQNVLTDLLDKYNKLVTLLSLQFLEWDEKLSVLEARTK